MGTSGTFNQNLPETTVMKIGHMQWITDSQRNRYTRDLSLRGYWSHMPKMLELASSVQKSDNAYREK